MSEHVAGGVGETIDIPEFLRRQGDIPSAPAAGEEAGVRPLSAASIPADPPSDGFERVSRLRLRGVDCWFGPDIADRLYQAPGVWLGSGDSVVNLDSGARRYRLRALLSDAAVLGVVENRRTRRHDYQEFTPQDILLLIPHAVYDKYLDMGGLPVAHLTDRLQELVEQDYGGRFIARERGANVAVKPADLPIDEAIFMCGPAVFIPNDADRQSHEVSVTVVTASGAARPKEGFRHTVVKPVAGQRSGASETRAGGIYAGQSSFLIGVDETTAPNVLPESLGVPKGATMLVSLSPDRARGDGTHLAREGKVEQKSDGSRIFRFSLAQPARTPGQKLVVEIMLRPVAAVQEPIAADGASPDQRFPASGAGGWWRRLFRRSRENPASDRPRRTGEPRKFQPFASARASGGDSGGNETIVISAADVRSGGFQPLPSARTSPHCLSVVAILAPRFPAVKKGPPSWSLAITPTGEITVRPTGAAPTADRHLALLGGRSGDPRLYVIPANRQDWEVVNPLAPPRLHPDGKSGALVPLAEPLLEHYHMLLKLAKPRPFPLLAEGEQLIGRRSDAGPGPGGDLPKVQFGLLDLRGSVDGDGHGTLEQINLSRDHVRAAVAGDQLQVRMHAGRTSVWRLDAAFVLQEELRPGQPQPIRLALGEHLLIGCYVVRFASFERE